MLAADDNANRYIAEITRYYEHDTETEGNVRLVALTNTQVYHYTPAQDRSSTNFRKCSSFSSVPLFAQNADGRATSRRVIQSINPLP